MKHWKDKLIIAMTAGTFIGFAVSPAPMDGYDVAALAVMTLLSIWSVADLRRAYRGERSLQAALDAHIDERSNAGRKLRDRPARAIRLSAHALTRVNVQRRITGRPALSPAGIHRAAVHHTDSTSLQSQNDWLLYFLMLDHTSGSTNGQPWTQSHDKIGEALEVIPGGGAFGGAGASAAWFADPHADMIDAGTILRADSRLPTRTD